MSDASSRMHARPGRQNVFYMRSLVVKNDARLEVQARRAGDAHEEAGPRAALRDDPLHVGSRGGSKAPRRCRIRNRGGTAVSVKEAPARVEMVCIACPVACRLTVTTSAGGEISVSGNRCPQGEAYGSEEVKAPRRILTAVVPTDSAHFPCAPVRTDRAIGRDLVKRLLAELYARTVSLPVRRGQVSDGRFRRRAGGFHPDATTG